jgi:hypothetical protein
VNGVQCDVPIPEHLYQSKLLHTDNQIRGIPYLAFRTDANPYHRFTAPELAEKLGIDRRRGFDLLRAYARKSIVKDVGNKRIDIPENLQRNNWTYYNVHEYVAVIPTLHSLLYNQECGPTTLNGTNTGNNRTPEKAKSIPHSLSPTFYNLKLKEQRELLIKWNQKDLWDEWCARPIPIKPLPVTFYNLTLMEKILQVQKWDESENWSMENAVHEWIDRLAREMREEREIAEYESFPDPELDLLKNQFKHRNCFKDFHGVSEYSGLRTCPIKIYGKETYL